MRYPLAAVVVLPLLAVPVLADGFFAPSFSRLGQSTTLVESPKQEAIIVLDKRAKTITVSLRTHFRAGPTDLAWVIPVPVKPDSIDKGNEDVFRALETNTAPEFFAISSTGGGIGCSSNESANRIGQGVNVVNVGTAGIFDYVVLDATDADVLVGWLNSNDYRVPADANQVFRRYVDLGWHWLAIRLRAETKNLSTLAPHPITYRYRGTRIEYPLVISSLSATAETEVVLYVLADSRYGCKNWANGQIESRQLALDDTSSTKTNYETLVRQLTTDHGGHLFVTEFAADILTYDYKGPLLAMLHGLDYEADILESGKRPRPSYLTRLRAVVTKDALDRDVVLVPKFGTVTNYHELRVPREGHLYVMIWAMAITFIVVCAVLYVVRR